MATALAVRDRVVERFLRQMQERRGREGKHVYYLSLEFLIGRLLRENVGNLGLAEAVKEALAELGVTPDQARLAEPDAALGNGGLGRLAACFSKHVLPRHPRLRLRYPLRSRAVPADPARGWQQEFPRLALLRQPLGIRPPRDPPPHRLRRRGRDRDPPRRLRAPSLHPGEWGMRSPTTRRSSAARPPRERAAAVARPGAGPAAPRCLQPRRPSGRAGRTGARRGDLKVLYPADDSPAGQELRLRQEFFFTSAALQDLLRRQLRQAGSVDSLAEHAAIQLNDTHPAIAVAELMRLLVDEHDLPWETAWEVTRGAISYTNHTLLPEALESWPVPLMERLLPRHMQIIYRINAEHPMRARRPSGDDALLARSR